MAKPPCTPGALHTPSISVAATHVTSHQLCKYFHSVCEIKHATNTLQTQLSYVPVCDAFRKFAGAMLAGACAACLH